jgi:hypothetical protein
MSAKYGTVLNVTMPYEYVGTISDSNGNVVCEVDEWAETFMEKGVLTYNHEDRPHVSFQIDLETGAILNWNPKTRDEIVAIIEKETSHA